LLHRQNTRTIGVVINFDLSRILNVNLLAPIAFHPKLVIGHLEVDKSLIVVKGFTDPSGREHDAEGGLLGLAKPVSEGCFHWLSDPFFDHHYSIE
jgi:hypothetical protein